MRKTPGWIKTRGRAKSITTSVIAIMFVIVGCGSDDAKRSNPQPKRDYTREAREYYDAHREEFMQPRSRVIGHILVSDRSKAQELYRQLQGKDRAVFARLALRHSIDRASSREGGTMTVYQKQSIPAIDKVAFGLKTGQLSRPFKSSAGFHLILALEPARPPGPKSFAQVRPQIEAMLMSSNEGS